MNRAVQNLARWGPAVGAVRVKTGDDVARPKTGDDVAARTDGR